MKLSPECMRDCLLYLESVDNIHICTDEEETTVSFEPIFLETIFADIKNWSNHDIFYALFNLQQCGYIDASKDWADDSMGNYCVNYITFHGHEFLNGIRDDVRWQGIKKGLDAVRNYSLSAIGAISEGLVSGAVSAYLSQQTAI